MLGELSLEQIEALLASQTVARIGCHAEGRTYVVPISYAYDGRCLIGHSVPGLKIHMMRLNPEVCIEVDHMENLGNWQSVIAWGRYEELSAVDSLIAMRFMIDRFRPLMTSATTFPSHGLPELATLMGSRAIFFRIRLEEKTGRFEQNGHRKTDLTELQQSARRAGSPSDH